MTTEVEEEARTMVVYRSCDGYDFKVSEEVVFKSRLMKDLYLDDKNENPEKKIRTYCIPGITRDNLAMVINYCNNPIGSHEIIKLDIVSLFNLIQAAHSLKIQQLMDMTCDILVIKNRQIMHDRRRCLDNFKFWLRNQQHSEDADMIKQQTLCSLSELPQFWCCLRNMLCSKLKKFQKEACQIISNIAARRKTLIKDVVEANIEEHLCGLLQKVGSDVKMEAAWAIFNIICAEEHLCSMLDVKVQDAFTEFYMTCGPIVYDHIDKYPG